MFSVALSPSSNQRMSQANRMDRPVCTVKWGRETGILGCHGSLRSPVGHPCSGHTTRHVWPLRCLYKKTLCEWSKYCPVCFYLYFFLFQTNLSPALTGPRFCLHEFAVQHDTLKRGRSKMHALKLQRWKFSMRRLTKNKTEHKKTNTTEPFLVVKKNVPLFRDKSNSVQVLCWSELRILKMNHCSSGPALLRLDLTHHIKTILATQRSSVTKNK